MKMKCKICKREWKSKKSLLTHIRRAHSIDTKDYYDKYLNSTPSNSGECRYCGKPTKFKGLEKGWHPICNTKKCISKYISERTQQYKDNEPTENREAFKTKLRENWKNKSDEDKKKILKVRATTNEEKYGVKYISQVNSVKQHISEAHLSRTKEDIEISNKKRESTCIKKYGVPLVRQSDVLKRKIKLTKLEKYGDENYNNHDKIKLTKLEKYGDENYNNVNEIKSSRWKIKYGKLFTSPYSDNIIPLFNIDEYIGVKSKKYKFKCIKCNTSFNYNITSNRMPTCRICHPIINSIQEKVVADYVKTLLPIDTEILLNSRSIISPLELDIYIPELKLAIEYDGLYWHSDLYKDKNYHKVKTELCEDAGINLIHIFEDEWINKTEITKSRLANILGKSNERIYARKCKVKEIPAKVKNKFLNANHIQGEDKSNVKVGLFYEDKLISVMTFGKLRAALGNKKNKNDNIFELIRFASKINTTVTGGASKLFSYFINHYNPIEIHTFADKRWSRGNLYDALGFEYSHTSTPNYWYIKDNIRYHRYNFRKHSLSKKLNIFDPILTEKQNMKNNNYLRIYDSGHMKFIWTR